MKTLFMKQNSSLFKVHTTVLFISGILIMFVAFLAFIAHILDIEYLKAWQFSEMPIPVAICLLTVGFNMVFLAFRLNGRE